MRQPWIRRVRSALLVLAPALLAGCGAGSQAGLSGTTADQDVGIEAADTRSTSTDPNLAGRAAGEAVPGRFIVVLKDGVSPDDVARAHGVQPDHRYRAALNGFAGPASEVQAGGLRTDPRVLSVEPDRVVILAQPIDVEVGGTGDIIAQAGDIAPTGVNRIDAEDVPAAACSGVGVAVIDTGILLNHADLQVLRNRTFVDGTSTGNDDNGHGTHVAGTVAAKADTTGLRGVAPGAPLYAVKVLDSSGSGYLTWVIAGVDWVTSHNASFPAEPAIKVANMSLGFRGSSTALNTAIARSVASGITYAVAAGNSRSDASRFSPANHPDVIAVSAVADSNGYCGGGGAATSYGKDDAFASFSNYGATVDIAAPGVNIYSCYKNGGYATMSGTSMASPHVAGAAAVAVALGRATTPTEVRAALTAAAVKKSDGMGTNTGTGFGYFSGDRDKYPEPLVYVQRLLTP